MGVQSTPVVSEARCDPVADRDRVLGLFTQIVSELGCGDRSLELILAASGLSLSGFEGQFGSLEECFLEVIERTLVRYGPIVAHAYTSAESRQEGMDAACAGLLELLSLDRPLAMLLLVRSIDAGPRVRARREQLLGDLVAILQRDALRSIEGAARLEAWLTL